MSLTTTIAAAPELAASASVQAGLISWTEDTATNLEGVLRVVAVTVAVLFVVFKAVQSKFAIGTIILSAVAAGVFIWIVFNVVSLRDTVGEDLPGGAPAVVDVSDHAPA